MAPTDVVVVGSLPGIPPVVRTRGELDADSVVVDVRAGG